MKWFGALLIILTSTWAGFVLAKQFSERPRQLRQLKVALQSLEAEIMFGQTPIKDASDHLAGQLRHPISTFFELFSKRLSDGQTTLKEAWEKSLSDIWRETALKAGEREIMHQFGATLGRHDRDNQQKQIRLALAHLEREEAEARDAQMKYEKMIKSLGFLTGLLLVLLLL